MLFNRIFRERALQRLARQEPLDDRLQITAPHEWLIVAGFGLAVLALLAFAVFGRVERTASLEAVLALPGERQFLVAPAQGTVADVFVLVGDTVDPGQTVAHIRPTETQLSEAAIEEIVNVLENSERIDDVTRIELLRALLVAGSAASPPARIEVKSPIGGKVVALDLAPGQAVQTGASAGLVRTEAGGRPEIVAFVASTDAAGLSAGMAARVSIAVPGASGRKILKARVVEVSPYPVAPPRWLAERALANPQPAHLLRASLVGEVPDSLPADGTAVSLQIVLGRVSLVSLLAPGGGA